MRACGFRRYVAALTAAILSAAAQPAMAADERCVALIQTQNGDWVTRLGELPSPDCLQIRPATRELGPAGNAGQCVAAGAGSVPTLAASGSPSCIQLTDAGQVSVLRAPQGACLGVDRRGGAVRILTPKPGAPEGTGQPGGPSPDATTACLAVDTASGLLGRTGIDPVTGTLSPVGCVPAPQGSRGTAHCARIDPVTGTLSPVGCVPAPADSQPLAYCFVESRSSGELLVATPGRLWARSSPRLALTIDYAWLKTEAVGSGVLISGGPGSEQYAVRTNDTLDFSLVGLRLQESEWGTLQFGYGEGDAAARASEPIGGVPVGVIYYQPSPTGSLGINYGRSGGRFQIDSDFRFLEASYTLPWALYRSEQEDCKTSIRPVISWEQLRETNTSLFQSLGIPDTWSQARQRVHNDWYGVGLAGRHVRRFSDAVTGRFAFDLGLLYNDARLESQQWNACGAPGCPPGSTFTAVTDDSSSGFGWSIDVGGAIEYALTRNSRVGVEAGYRYLDRYAALVNPIRTIDLDAPPHLDKENASRWTVGLTYRYAFD